MQHQFVTTDGRDAAVPSAIYSYKGHPSPRPRTLALFTDVDRIQVVGTESKPHKLIFDMRIGALRECLDVLGYDDNRLLVEFERLRTEEAGRKRAYLLSEFGWSNNRSELRDKLERNIGDLHTLTYEEWKGRIRSGVAQGLTFQEERLDGTPFLPINNLDELVLLRALCAVLPDAGVLRLDLSHLTEGNRIAARIDEPVDDVPVTINVDPPSPAIIITEGSFDAFALRSALNILRPHLNKYITFLESEMKHQGGASSAVRTLRSFAAAGVSNRVVAIFDNDSAARQEVMLLSQTRLPARFRFTHYPDLDHARTYPTFGPQGRANLDVNGLAGSIELYLGSDVLKAEDGEFEPVQWTGYQDKIGKYQGVILNKARVQDSFRDKVAEAERNPRRVVDQDWSSLDLIIRHLMDTLAKM